MSARFELAAVCAAALVCGNCSLVVDELHLDCTKPSDCDALNEEHGIDPNKDCFVYQCRSDGRGCEKRAKDLDGDRAPAVVCDGQVDASVDCDDNEDGGALSAPGLPEACDHRDNDCNGFVNDRIFARPAFPREIEDDNIVHVAHTDGVNGALYVAVTSQAGNEFTTNVWKYQAAAPAEEPVRAKLASSVERPERLDCTDVQCTFVEFALATAPDLLLGLGVNKAGCRAGQIRVGGVGRDWEPASGSFPWIQSLSTCPSPDNLEGASRASLGLLPMQVGSRQGLALWRAARDNLAGPLAGTGLWIDAREEAPPAVQSTGAGAEQLARSEGNDAPAIAPWLGGADGGGYFVAYDTTDAVEIAFIPRLEGRSAQALNGWLRAEPITEPGAQHVVLTVDTDPDALFDRPRGLGAAWRTKAGDIRFARISYERRATTPLTATTTTLASDARIVEGPQIAYVRRGIRTGDRPGGWLVTWIEDEEGLMRLVGTRVPEAEHTPEAPFTIYQAGQLGRLFAFRSDESTPGYGFIATEAREQLYISSLTCESRN